MVFHTLLDIRSQYTIVTYNILKVINYDVHNFVY